MAALQGPTLLREVPPTLLFLHPFLPSSLPTSASHRRISRSCLSLSFSIRLSPPHHSPIHMHVMRFSCTCMHEKQAHTKKRHAYRGDCYLLILFVSLFFFFKKKRVSISRPAHQGTPFFFFFSILLSSSHAVAHDHHRVPFSRKQQSKREIVVKCKQVSTTTSMFHGRSFRLQQRGTTLPRL